jgi:hypothetical protein
MIAQAKDPEISQHQEPIYIYDIQYVVAYENNRFYNNLHL